MWFCAIEEAAIGSSLYNIALRFLAQKKSREIYVLNPTSKKWNLEALLFLSVALFRTNLPAMERALLRRCAGKHRPLELKASL